MKTKAKKATAADWNARNGIGTKVRYWPIMGVDEHVDSVTRSAAWDLGGHTAVVQIEGRGSVALSHLHVLEAVAPGGAA